MKPNRNQMSPQKKGKHLTYSKRCTIKTLLDEGESMRYIADKIGCSPSTVSREIRKHTITQKSYINDCLNRNDCRKRNVCSSNSCRKRCKTCNKCKKYCEDYIQSCCEALEEKGYDAKTGKMLVCVNPKFFRPTDVVNLLGDPTKAKTKLGWNPQKTSYEQLCAIMAEHDLQLAKKEAASR